MKKEGGHAGVFLAIVFLHADQVAAVVVEAVAATPKVQLESYAPAVATLAAESVVVVVEVEFEMGVAVETAVAIRKAPPIQQGFENYGNRAQVANHLSSHNRLLKKMVDEAVEDTRTRADDIIARWHYINVSI